MVDGDVPRRSADQDVEKEIEKFLDSAAAAAGGETKRTFDNISQKARQSLGLPPERSSVSADLSSTQNEAAEEGQGSESIYPETMSCRSAFDRAFYCNSLGGQITNVYRYGSTRDCKPNWSEFWFCMKLKSQDEASRRRKIRDWYIRKEAEIKLGPSSEDVWEVRKEPLSKAFDMDPDAESS